MVRHIIGTAMFVIIVVLLAGVNLSMGETMHSAPSGHSAFIRGEVPLENTSLLAFNAFNSQKNDSLSAAGDLYLYAVATGGGAGISGENFSPDVNATNSAGASSVVVIGHSLSRSTSFSTSAGSYTIAEAKVRGGIADAYTFQNDSSGAGGLNGKFTVQSNGSLVVIMAAASSENSISITSSANFNFTLKQGTAYTYILLGYQYLKKGTYNFTAKTSATAGNPYPGYMSIGTAVYVFSPVSLSSSLHMTYFTLSGLPQGMDWNISYAKMNKSSNFSIIWFQVPNGSYNWWTASAYYKGINDERASVNRTSGINIVNGSNSLVELKVTVQYWVNIVIGGSNGKVKPASGWYNESSSIWVTAIPDPGFYAKWVGKGLGNYTGPNNEAEITVLSQINETAIFSVEKYNESFTESGLPAGTAWWVNLSGIGNVSTTGTTIIFYLPNGTYNFRDGSTGYNSSLPEGYLGVSGEELPGTNITNITSIGFQRISSEKFYPVTFYETGLMNGTIWYVAVNQTAQTSDATAVSLRVINGTYPFSPVSPGYTANVSSGSLSVNGTPVVVYIRFTRDIFVLHEGENGSPGLNNGSVWEITVNGVSYYSTTDSMNITLANGTYSYSVNSPVTQSEHLWYILPKDSGVISGSGIDISMNISFVDSYSWEGSTSMKYPYAGTYDAANGLVYIANYSSSSSGDNYVVVLSGNRIVDTIPIGFSYPYSLTYDPVNEFVYVANYESSDITVINGTRIVAEIPVNYDPYYVTSDPVTGYVYVANYGTATISIISNLTVVGTVNVGEEPTSVAVDPENGYLYVGTNYGYVYVLDGQTTVAAIATGSAIYSMAFDPANGYVYAALYQSNTVMAISGLTPVGNVTTGTEPYSITYDSDNGLLYVANYGSDNISVINGLDVIMQIPTGNGPSSVLVNLLSGEIYVADYNSNSVATVSFPTESFVAGPGYKVGSTWGIKVNGGFVSNVTQYSSNSTIVFALISNSTYSYSAITPGFNVSNSEGMFSAGSVNTSTSLSFSLNTYAVIITEIGLPSGTVWYANLSNGQSFHSTGSTLIFSVPNGSYSFVLSTVNRDYMPTGTGSFKVSGKSPPSINVTFVPVRFGVTFTENGLPQGTVWYVNITSLTVTLRSSSYTFYLTNGSYQYEISISNHTYRPEYYTAIVTVNGRGVTENISFVPVVFQVTFRETGLTAGQLWSVTIAGNTFTSNGSTISFNLTNGTYYYQILAGSGSSATSYQGVVEVSGVSGSINVSFAPASTLLSSIIGTLPYAISAVSLAVSAIAFLVIRRKT